jgi:drug/metabolite transporter (DMT)-like permease
MYALWSSVFSLTKIALQYSPPVFLTGFRMLIGGVVLLAYLVFSDKKSFKLNKIQWISIFLFSVFSCYLTNVLEYWALQYLSSAKVCFIYSLSPFLAAFFSYLHFDEKINLRKVFGLGLGVLGMIPIFSLQTSSEKLFGSFVSFSLPTLAMIGAVVCSVYGWVLLRLMVKDFVISPIMANGSSMAIGGVLSLLHSFFSEFWHPIPVQSHLWPSFLISVFSIIFVSNIVCSNLYALMLRRFTATFLSFVGLLSPVFATLYGFFFLGEPISWLIFLSMSIVCLGLWFVYCAEIKMGYIASLRKD